MSGNVFFLVKMHTDLDSDSETSVNCWCYSNSALMNYIPISDYVKDNYTVNTYP